MKNNKIEELMDRLDPNKTQCKKCKKYIQRKGSYRLISTTKIKFDYFLCSECLNEMTNTRPVYAHEFEKFI